MIGGLGLLLRGVWTRAGKIIGGVGEWLREPHEWWRIGFFVMGGLFGLASFKAQQNAGLVVLVTNERDAAAVSFKAQLQGKDLVIAGKDAQLLGYSRQQEEFARIARLESAKLEAARAASASATAEVERLEAAAERSKTAWWANYAKRPDACKAAQEAMDATCASLGEF